MATSKLVLICNTEISRVVPAMDLPFRLSTWLQRHQLVPPPLHKQKVCRLLGKACLPRILEVLFSGVGKSLRVSCPDGFHKDGRGALNTKASPLDVIRISTQTQLSPEDTFCSEGTIQHFLQSLTTDVSLTTLVPRPSPYLRPIPKDISSLINYHLIP